MTFGQGGECWIFCCWPRSQLNRKLLEIKRDKINSNRISFGLQQTLVRTDSVRIPYAFDRKAILIVLDLAPGLQVYINRGQPPGCALRLSFPPNRSLRALEDSEARAPRPGQCRWRPEGLRYAKTLKEKLRYVPDYANAIDYITFSPPTPMDNASAGKHPNLNLIPL